MAIETTRFDVLDHLKTPEDCFAHLEAAFEAGDPSLVAHALGDVARSIGITVVAKDLGVTREALYKSLSEDGDPKLSTLLGVAKALGIKLTVEAVDKGNNNAEARLGA
ncbi:putative addiction module antidote protein [Sinorhizobium meliloti]|uniref:addiction module antidote protein n=1 Tax=Rhizobium meliloti TaxID=382 RepID=UPI0012977916|nr:addiction module antidote protein [Sinorhizobium meliloti]MQW63962.1 putative addiction module antidote protein [Sinorhizobium meliloti]